MTSSLFRTQGAAAGWQNAARTWVEIAASRDPGWMVARRATALAALEEFGPPGRRAEAWRYTDLAPLHDALSGEGRAVLDSATASLSRLGSDPRRFSLSPGVTLTTWRPGAALDSTDIDRLQEALGPDEFFHGVDALRAAALSRVLLIDVAPGARVPEALSLDRIADPSAGGTPADASVVVVRAGAGAELMLVEHFRSPGPTPRLRLPETRIRLERGARMTHLRIQSEGSNVVHMGRSHVSLEAEAQFDFCTVSAGARLGREEVIVRLRGPGAHAALDGLYAPAPGSVHDHVTRIEHIQPDTTSRQTYKGVLGPRSHGIFFGSILIHRGAQRTSSSQLNRNLLLSADARADARPWLEILADDVRCTHGATVGQLDPEALFALEARGLGPDRARRMLVRAFALEPILQLPGGAVRDEGIASADAALTTSLREG